MLKLLALMRFVRENK